MSRVSIAMALGVLTIFTGCAAPPAVGTDATVSAIDGADAATSITTSPVAAPTTSAEPTTTTSTTTTTTTPSTTVAATTSSTTAAPTSSSVSASSIEPPPAPVFTAANRAFDELAAVNQAVTMTVHRDGRAVLQRASGWTLDGDEATADSPMVVASVSKLLTALMVARLAEARRIDLDAPVAWSEFIANSHPEWAGVTARELLAHTSGMPVVRSAWFDGGLDCATFLAFLVDRPPTATRGRWTYSNGNYCALGRLVEDVTGMALDAAAQSILFDPLGVSGAHLTTDGQLPADVEYRPGVARLSRLGGAGTFIVSTDDLAAVLAAVTPSDVEVLTWPGVFIDQYGWGHTGTVDGASACAWVLEGGRTVVAATVSGRSPSTGGGVCDRVVLAVAEDLGIAAGRPDRSPP